MKPPCLEDMRRFYVDGKHNLLARWLPYFKGIDDPFIIFLFESNLLTIGKWAKQPVKFDAKNKELTGYPISLGADPEFILCDKEMLEHGVVEIELFSSKYTDNYFGISQAEIGADYGLLEFRAPPSDTPDGLIDKISKLQDKFIREFQTGEKKLELLELEAVELNHKRKRTLEMIKEQDNKDRSYKGYGPNYGGYKGYGPNYGGYKDISIWPGRILSSIKHNKAVDLSELVDSGIKLSAYDKPNFPERNNKILSAGGHFHVGGSFIKMLSFEQTKAFIRVLDGNVLPICNAVETEAGELRRKVYGTLGEFRLKKYGVEWRTPSNAIFWRKNLQELRKVLDRIVEIATNMALTNHQRA